MDNAKICCLKDFMMEYTLWNMCFNKNYIYRYIFIFIHTYIIILSIISGVDSAMSAY